MLELEFLLDYNHILGMISEEAISWKISFALQSEQMGGRTAAGRVSFTIYGAKAN